MSVKEKLIDGALRFLRKSDSFIFKFNLTEPFNWFWAGFQRKLDEQLSIGLCMEHSAEDQISTIKMNGLIRWHSDKKQLLVDGFINSHRQLGLSLTYRFESLPIVLQTFALYSLVSSQWNWGVGFQLII